jgi:hypothetical protein
MLDLTSVAFGGQGTQRLEGVNTYLQKYMRLARKEPKLGWRKLNFGRQDCFLDHLFDVCNDRYNYVRSIFFIGHFSKTPPKRSVRRNRTIYGTEGVLNN